ncbi:MAG: capsular polysaccharide biosynthesis protein [Clostridia bacterium]|nr:capsular polysaccharide biosynthesis protein [Clostridia bacterium]
MIDFHSHILPGIDDGSADVRESSALLTMLREQGVKTVVATPHFYPGRMSVSGFLERRKEAFERLCETETCPVPQILLGAEVRYYDGIRHMEDLELLCIEGSRVLLLEMPFEKWSEMTIKEVATLSRSSRVTVVLAHIERYASYQDPNALYRLLESGVLMQANAGFFTGRFSRRRALGMLSQGLIHVIGSDCHNITSRPPQIGRAAQIIEKRFGSECLDHISEFTRDILCISNINQ